MEVLPVIAEFQRLSPESKVSFWRVFLIDGSKPHNIFPLPAKCQRHAVNPPGNARPS